MLRSALIGCLLLAPVVLTSVAVGQPTPFASYNFNDSTTGAGGIIDSVGGRNGTLVDPAGAFGVIGGGQVNLSANNGNNSAAANADEANPVGAYIDLPNGIINDAFSGGTGFAATIETWFTVSTNRNFARLWDFGTSNAGEDISNGAADSLYFAPQSGFGVEGSSNPALFETRDAALGSDPPFSRINPTFGDPAAPGPIPTGEEQHLVVSINGDSSGFGGGTATFFLNGVQLNTVDGNNALAEFFITNTFATLDGQQPVNQWLGRSQFGGDALFDGFYNEFNLYSSALNASDVTTLFNDGPDAFVGPTVNVNRDTGEITLTNETGETVNITAYSLTSEVGVLNPTGATALAGLGGGTSSINEISQSGGSETIDNDSLGLAWVRSPFEDLALEFTLGGDTLSAAVVYTGVEIQRSDLDVDGDIDLDDYAIFLANSFATDVAGETAIDAYFRGDISGDLAIDVADFLLFKGDFLAAGGTAAELAAFAIPEPSAALLLVAGVSLFAPRRRG